MGRRRRTCPKSALSTADDNVKEKLTAFDVDFTDGSEDFGKDKKSEKSYEPASWREMYRYAENTDYLLLFFGILFAMLNGFAAPFASVIFRGISDVLMNGQAAYDKGIFNYENFSRGILYHCFLYLCLGVSMFVLNYFALGFFHTLSERQSSKIQSHFFNSVLRQDMEWFDKHETGALTQIMTSGIEKYRHGTTDKLILLIKAFANVLSAIVVGVYLNWKLATAVMTVAPILSLLIWLSNAIMIKMTKREAEVYKTASGMAEEVISAIQTVVAFNAQFFELKRYSEKVEEAKKIGFKKAFVVAAMTGLHMFIYFSAMGVVFWYGSTLIQRGETTPGTVLGVFLGLFMAALRFGMAIPQFATIIAARVSAGEIFSMIDTNPKLDRVSGQRPTSVEGRIVLKDVRFAYPSRPSIKVLDGISLTVEPGENVALVGHSGCGKSTSIGLLMRYYSATSGTVSIDGIPVEDLNVDWIRNTIGVVSQEPVLFQASIADNLRLGKSDVTEAEMEAACRAANAHEFIVKLPDGYETRIGDGGVKLSGGQKQRLAIARAIVREPKILLLDEATSALDTESERLVQAALDAAASGRTTITIAHRLSTVRNASKIVVFDQGHIIETGTHDELMAMEHGFYRKLVASQDIEELFNEEKEFPDSGRSEETSEVFSATVSPPSSRMSLHEDVSASLTSLMTIDETKESTDKKKSNDLVEYGAEAASICDIFKYARSEVRFAIVGFITCLLRGASWPLYSFVYGLLFKLWSNQDSPTFDRDQYIVSGSFIAIGFLAGTMTWLSGYIFGRIGEKLSGQLRCDVYTNIMRQDAAYFDDPRNSVGKLTARLSTDAANVQAAVDQRLADLVQGLTSLICGLALAFYFGYNFAPFCFVSLFISIGVHFVINSIVKKRASIDTVLAENVATLCSESISHVKTIQSLAKESHIHSMFLKMSNEPRKRAIVKGWLMSVPIALTQSFVSLNFCICYMIGLMFIKHGSLTPFAVFQVIEAINIATMISMMASSYFPEYNRAKISAGLIFHMLKQQPKIDSLSEDGAKPELSGDVTLKNVLFAYPNNPNRTVLDRLNIKARFGQTIALVGPSGCGKSTIIQLLERFYDVTGGSVRYGDVDVKGINVRHLRQSIALVGQEPTLFNLTIKENIAYGCTDIDDAKVIEAAKLANIDAFIAGLPAGYDTNTGGRGSQLSGGQRQRIAIARAIFREPRILLLDKATAALDGESEKLVQEALDRARHGRTCITIAHRLSTVQSANLICVIEGGKCVEYGTHQQLLAKKGLYARLVQKQKG